MNATIKDHSAERQKTLSEYESKRILEQAGIPIAKQGLARDRPEALATAGHIGYPVVMKGCGDTLTHKTEMGLVKTGIKDKAEAAAAYDALTSKGIEMDGVLVMEMLLGTREFVIGLTRDPQFGPCVMFGLGGVFTEAINDVSFRVAPLSLFDARDMINDIKAQKLLGAFRGQPAVDIKSLGDMLIRVGRLGIENPQIAEIDINPVIIQDDRIVAADALVVMSSVSP